MDFVFRNVQTVEEATTACVEARNDERLARINTSHDQGWSNVDTNQYRFSLPPMTHELSFAAVDTSRVTSLGDIFLAFVTPEILTASWGIFPKEYWCYGFGKKAGTFNKGLVSLKLLYTFLAVYIFIVGEQNGPKEGSGMKRPLRNSIARAVDHFKIQYPGQKIVSASLLDRFWGRFYFPAEIWPSICRNFQNLLLRPGRCLAGDEKLLHFAADSGYIRLVPSKPDRTGLRFFELVVILDNGDPFLVHAKLSNSSASSNGDSIPVNAVVEEWAKVAQFFVEMKRSQAPILVFDSYYTDNEGRKILNENNVKFIGAIVPSRFTNLMDNLAEYGDMVEKPGQTASIFKEETNEIFVHHWDIMSDIGKKYVISNAFDRVPATSANPGVVPVYDQYKNLFNACDKFNRNLHERKYCHRTGGNTRTGDNGQTFKFIMACILQNTFNAYKSTLTDATGDITFRDMCQLLSSFLVGHSLNIP